MAQFVGLEPVHKGEFIMPNFAETKRSEILGQGPRVRKNKLKNRGQYAVKNKNLTTAGFSDLDKTPQCTNCESCR